jgi:hypothetical protein
MKKITKAVFGYGRPSTKSKGLTFASLRLVCTENSLAPGERK